MSKDKNEKIQKKSLQKKNLRVMVQGTASDVGKSVLSAAFCRMLTRDGYDVNPFKSQNMSLNSYITPEGLEMGRAQVMQAEASYKEPSALMNPILLKPTSDRKSQVIVKGKVHGNMDAVEYFAWKPTLRQEISNIYHELEEKSDVVVIEGAGSPAEINLVENDFVNMGMADIADAPVILVADIDRGGVFASIAGTLMLMPEEHKKRVKGVVINKFRGSKEILQPGVDKIEEITNVPVLGVIPYFTMNLEDEDGMSKWLTDRPEIKDIDIAIIRLPYMSNHTDFNSLMMHEGVSVRFVKLGESIGKPDVVIIPGTKSTIADMISLRNSTTFKSIKTCFENGSRVIGICGGYQILGKVIVDKDHTETNEEFTEGLGILDVNTIFEREKNTTLTVGVDEIFGHQVKGYEIHMGVTKPNTTEVKPFVKIGERIGGEKNPYDGSISADGKVFGTYLHGIFDNSKFTNEYLNVLRKEKGLSAISTEDAPENFWDFKDKQYDKLADLVEANIDKTKLYEIIGIGE